MNALCSLFMFIGRLCLAAPFLWAGIGKWLYYDQTLQYMTSKGLTMAPSLLIGASIVEVVGALLLIFGYKTRFGALILLLFLIATTAIFHDFWNVTGADQQAQLTNFLKNLGIAGGLLYVLCCGSGGLAVSPSRRKEAPGAPSKPS